MGSWCVVLVFSSRYMLVQIVDLVGHLNLTIGAERLAHAIFKPWEFDKPVILDFSISVVVILRKLPHVSQSLH